ncbi:MAG: hypothetical protein IPK26_08110 [Planctomycetes bacterium]|nr:hypothetical protein [Planctomycetota bacterium]
MRNAGRAGTDVGIVQANLMSAASHVAVVLAGCAIVSLSGCALTAPPAEAVLSAAHASSASDDPALPLAERGIRLQAAVDRAAADALAAAKAAPTDLALAAVATTRLFEAADLQLQRAAVAFLATVPAADLATVLAADDRVDDATRTAILALCSEGLRLAESAAASAPADVAPQLHIGLHLSLIAWANGPARSLFAGYGPRLVAAIDRAVAAGPEFDHGAPLRLQGRFRGQAPWPYGDRPVARAALQRALAVAPELVNHLFLGDVLAADGEVAAARDQWQRAVTAAALATPWSAPFLRELAERRLQASASR